MKVFEFTNYKDFVLRELKSKPKAGHGEFQKIARALNVHSTMISHIFRGDLDLSIEQGFALANYLHLNELETDYFLNLLQIARAGEERTKKYFERKLAILRDKALNIGARLDAKNVLDEKDQAVFYSSWIYAAIRLLSAIPKFQNRNAIAEELNLPSHRINQALDFLISRGLCVDKGNRIVYGEVQTYVSQESPLVGRHHVNWRLKSVGQIESLLPSDLAYTNPVVINEKDFLKIREEIVQFIERFNRITEPSPSEKLCCLNIDWIHVKS